MAPDRLPRIAGISAPFPGARRPLEEGAKLGLWEFVLLEGERVRIPPAEVHILAAWHPVYEQLLGLGGRIGVCWTSSGGEMDLEPVEREWLTRVLADPRISFVWFGDPSLAQVYPEKGFYAPYPMYVDEVSSPQVEKRDIATLFCPTGPKKNILNQLLAMRLAQRERRLTLHTNVQGYDRELAALDCVRHGWLPQAEHQALIASARVNLACSWAETFHYGAAEAALLGTPSVVSTTVPIPGRVVANPNSPRDIADAILGNRKPYWVTRPNIPALLGVFKCRNAELSHTLRVRLGV